MEKTSLSHIVRPVTKHLEYVTSSRKRVRYMIEIMKELEGISSDIKMRISSSRRKNLEVPASVNGWLDEVEKIKEDVGRISNMAVGHFNMKLMYQAGRSASEATRRIQKLITEQKSITWTDATSEVTWTDARVPLGRIRSSGVDMFMSRQKPFEDALKFLQQDDNKNQVIALCGMGGVGKTTMMEQLQKVARDKKMFNFIVKVVIGKSPNIFSIQNDLALWLGGEGLRETTITARADTIHKKIKEILDGENRRILVILDDVWEKLELKDIGLTSPLPKGIKVLLTSRSEVVCQQIASAVGSVVQVVSVFVLNETEAQFLFFASSGVSEEYNSDLYHIGCDIVKKCGGLPVAIITVALTLRSEEDRNVWHNTLRRFNKYDNNNSHYNFTHRVFEMSFENLRKDEDKEIFLHCALFPKDYDISLEYLAIYAWGLNLFKNVSTFREARERTKKCVHNLIGVNLLMSSNHLGCVKMHDLLHDFVLNRVSTGGLVWIIKHDDVSYWGSDERSAYCTRISLTCTGLSMVPTEFKYPNLSLLQLMHGDMLEFPEYFHENMENLQVIAYYKLQHPLLPRCSTRLRTLSLHGCTLESDYSFVGDLVNLEVLSFAHCGIRKLPSTIGNLKRLKLLDLTGCVDLQIDDGVFMNLDNLEELYMRVSDRKAIRFTDSNWDEFTILVRRLFALEAEFVEKKTRLENLSFNRLEKFKISIGCLLDEEEDEDDRSSFTNTLKIVTESESENDILDSQINKLFKETHKLHLQVQGVIGLEKNVSLGNLRDLTVSNCAELEYVFPIPVASGLIRLERLIVSSCSSLETLVCSNNGSEINSEGGEVIKFEALKFLCLEKLPELVSLFLVDTVVELPQLVELEVDGLPNFTGISSLLNNQIKTGKLEKLKIGHMEKLKQILTSSSEEEGNNVSMLREIKVLGCNSLVHLFPTNPMKLLIHLERLEVSKCGSIREIFNIDLESVGHEIEHVSPKLRRIRVEGCDSLVNLFPFNLLGLLNHLKKIEVSKCGSIKEIFKIDLERDGEVEHAWNSLRRIRVEGCDSLVNLFPSNLLRLFMNLIEIEIEKCGSIKEIFNIDLGRDGEVKEVSSGLRSIRVEGCGLSSIRVEGCDSLVNLFPSNLLGLLNQLVKIEVSKCGSIKEIFKIDLERDGEVKHAWNSLRRIRVEGCDSLVNLFPSNLLGLFINLKEIEIEKCGSIKEIFNIDLGRDGEVKEVSSGLRSIRVEGCRLRSIRVEGCDSLVNLFPSNLLGLLNQLIEIEVSKCGSIKEIFKIDLERDGEVEHAWNSLRRIRVEGCDSLVNLFPSNLLGLLNNLKEIEIEKCSSIKEIFNIDLGRDGEVKEVSSSLRSIRVEGCDSLVNLFPTNPMGLLNHLKEVKVKNCGSIKEIFNIDLGRGGDFAQVSSLRSILVEGCDSLVNLFSTNSVGLVNHLEELKVEKDGSIKLIFDIDLNLVSQTEQLSRRSRSIEVFYLEKVREVWRLNGGENNSSLLLISGFEYLERIKVEGCKGFKSVFVPTDTKFQMRALTDIAIKDCGESGRNMELVKDSHHKEIKFLSTKERDDNVSSAAFPSNFNYHRDLDIGYRDGLEMVLEIENQSNRNNEQPLLPNLVGLNFSVVEMSHVWKCSNWNNFLYLQKQHQQSSCHNLTTIRIRHCKNIKYLISSQMAKLLSNLKTIQISLCDDMEEVVLKEDEKPENVASTSTHTTTTFFPRLHLLSFEYMINLKRIDRGGVRDRLKQSVDSWSLCEYSRDIQMHRCNALSSVIPSYAVGRMQKLEVLKVHHCGSLMEVFETQNNIWSSTHTTHFVPQLTNLKKLVITFCGLLQHVFTFSTLKSLWKLEELTVSDCKGMKVIVKQENGEQENGEVQVFPCLKFLKFFNLPNLEGFFLGENGFQWPLLENVMISRCPQMKMFTFGQSTAPELKYIHTSLGKHSLVCGLNFHVTTDSHQTSQPSSLEHTNLRSTTLKQLPWSFCNLIQLNMTHCRKVKNIIPSNNLLQLHKLENIRVHNLFYVEEVFEVVAMEDANSAFEDSESDFTIKILRQVELKDLFSLKYIWKINPRIRLLFPNLTTMSVDNCNSLEHVFTDSMVSSLEQLQVLHISDCPNMKVVVKVEEKEEDGDEEEEEEFDARVKKIVLPSLKSLTLVKLKSLTGFCLGEDAFSWPALHTLEIKECPEITVITKGNLDTPKLNVIDTDCGRSCDVKEDLNSFIKNKRHEAGGSILEYEDGNVGCS